MFVVMFEVKPRAVSRRLQSVFPEIPLNEKAGIDILN